MRVTRIVASAVAVSSLLLMAACSSAASQSQSSGTASGSKPSTGSHTIGILESNDTSAAEEGWVSTAEAALKAIGWTADAVNGAGNPSTYEQAMQSFISEKVSGILTLAVDAAPIRAQLEAAQAAHIPVIAAGIDVNPQGQNLFSAVYAPSDQQYAAIMAKYIAAHYPKGTQYVTLNLTAVYGASETITAIDPLLQKAGYVNVGTCNMGAATIVQDAQACTSNLTVAHPQAKVFVSCCDFTPPITVPALQSAQRTDILSIAPYDDQASQALIQKGDNLALAVSNIDSGVLIAIGQFLGHAVKGTPVNPNAANDAFHYVMVDHANVPTGDASYFSTSAELASTISAWKTEYTLP